MSKVAQYLNEHLSGEVTTNDAIRRKFSTDASVLSMVPDMVIYPRTTSDIRKVARFSWQLAEKGHKLPITARGAGSDQTGAAIGAGVILNLQAHMNSIFELDAKQKLVRVQPGVNFRTLNQALRLQGFYIPSFPVSESYSTIGGAIANNASGLLSGKYGSTLRWVKQLEVVLSNGEVLQTGRIKKGEVQKRKGKQTFEGEIYRSIDNLITDNDSLIRSIAVDIRDNAGYNIVDVKNRDGSMDLTPLFIGSQGTLGVVSEIILHVESVSEQPLVGAIAFADYESALDGIDLLRPFDPAIMEILDARILRQASANGKKFAFYENALQQGDVGAVVIMEFDNPGAHAKKKIAKRIAKLFADRPETVVLEEKELPAAELRTMQTLPSVALAGEKGDICDPGLLQGAFIPTERLASFYEAVQKLEKKYHTELLLCGHASQNVYRARVLLDMKKPAERQKVLKLLAEWSVIVFAHGGHVTGEAAEGRLKSVFAYKETDDAVLKMFADIRAVFDPMDIMNTGVKQPIELKKLVEGIRPDFDGTDFAGYSNAN